MISSLPLNKEEHTIKDALQLGLVMLKNKTNNPRLDVEILLALSLKTNRTYLYTYPEAFVSPSKWQKYVELINKRAKGIPIAYITGIREFWSLPLKVGLSTLIPRPETELLVEISLKQLRNKTEAHVLDLGTGSGAIALACAFEKPNWQITAVDYCASALEIAKENAKRLNLTNLSFFQSDWLENIEANEQFDAIISNPPYIAEKDPHLFIGDLRFEPSLALIGGSDGLTAIKQIIQQSLARLKPNGLLLFEHGFDQKDKIRSMLNNYGFDDLQSWQDLQGKDRVTAGKRIIGSKLSN